MLGPRWAQLAIGDFINRKPRFYHDLFLPHPQQIYGVGRKRVEWFAVRSAEPQTGFSWPENHAGLVVFEGEKDFFERLHGWEAFVMRELCAITRKKWLDRATEVGPIPIGLHVRRGDFSEANSPSDFVYRGAVRTPVQWFAQSLEQVRRALGYCAPAVVFSDGNPSELRGLMRLKETRLVQTGSAIGDLLALSRSQVLLASGGSTFSAWASFFGKMPTIAVPGQSLTWYKLRSTDTHFQGPFEPDAPSDLFLRQVSELKQKSL